MSDPATAQGHWPPRSPHEALLSSPSGRDRLRRLQDRTSPSPSPSKSALKKTLSTPSLPQRQRKYHPPSEDDELSQEEDDGEDEETLQLKLQAIEARLKLKKLRQTRTKGGSARLGIDVPKDSKISTRTKSAAMHRTEEKKHPDAEGLSREKKSVRDVQVPLSPPQRKRPTEEPNSPKRVLLGIDKGLKGRNVSLRRAPISQNGDMTHNALGKATGGEANVHGSQRSSQALFQPPQPGGSKDGRPKSFSERIAETRTNDRQRQQKQERNRQSRSAGFGIDGKEMAAFKVAASTQGTDDPFLAEAQDPAPRDFTREEVLRSYNQGPGAEKRKLNSRSTSRPGLRAGSELTTQSTRASTSTQPASAHSDSSASARPAPPTADVDHQKESVHHADATNPASFESFSGLHLSKRGLPHNILTRTLSGKHLSPIPQLLKDVKSPNFDPPDVEGDWVVLGVVAAKSNPLDHKKNDKDEKGSKQENKRGKFMALTLTDLKWELDLYLFSSAFERFWKLTPGTVVAILNPSVMPPPPGKIDTGKFSLTLHSSDDTILEIGTARDLGFCKSMKKDGKLCNQWVDKRHTEFCAFHVDISVRKTMAGRMEVNTMGRLFDPDSKHRINHRSRSGPDTSKSEWNKQGGNRDVHSGARYFVAPSVSTGSGRSTAALLDDDDVDPDIFHRGSTKEERLRRRLAEQEREREIGRKLGEIGNGMGGAYLKAAQAEVSGTRQIGPDGATNEADPVDAQSLGLTGGEAASVRLSPMKRKRGQASSSSAPGMGWGSAYMKGLPKSGVQAKEKATDQPAKKKTRFITANGIREAGRESFGMPSSLVGAGAGDDDDDLDIV
ncbi:MAG: hypothetical protein M1837_005276 [Sclerophora amabilis]|nr:MAG: hypothetical protein M1837_005276 [Sclerophora amabilis]